jgi:uncharacterized protein (TIGR03083 family)
MLIWEMIAHQRRQLAHLLDDFDEAQWRTPSLCADWTVREVVGHLITPFAWGTAKFLRRFVVGGCNFHKTMSQAAKQLAQCPTSTLVGTLRAHAETRFAPPGLGPEASLIDIVMHTQDICRPLGIPQSVDGDRARRILDFLVSRKARVIKAWVLTDPSWVAGLRLAPDDLDWVWGEGSEVRGTAEAVMMVLGGRTAVLDELTGAGVAQLRARLAARRRP